MVYETNYCADDPAEMVKRLEAIATELRCQESVTLVCEAAPAPVRVSDWISPLRQTPTREGVESKPSE